MIYNLNVEIIDPNAIANIGTGHYKNIFPKLSYYNRKIFFYTPIPISRGPQWQESFPDPDTGDRGPFVDIPPPTDDKGRPVPIPKPSPF